MLTNFVCGFYFLNLKMLCKFVKNNTRFITKNEKIDSKKFDKLQN